MQTVGKYILSCGIAAMFVGVIRSFSDGKDSLGTLIRIICGLFLAFVLIEPVSGLDLSRLEVISQSYAPEAEEVVAYGASLASDMRREYIKAKTETYILDKARMHSCDIQVQVALGDDLLPESSVVSGYFTEKARQNLEQCLETELGIPKERQKWIGTESVSE